MVLNGLPQRLVSKGLIDAMQIKRAVKNASGENIGIVSYLLEHHIIESRVLAIAASEEFGIPLFNIHTLDQDPEVIQLIDDKLVRELHALPLFKRGKKLFVAISDPANLHALDQIQFNSGLNVEPILVEALALQQKIEEALDTKETTLSNLADTSLDELEFIGVEDELEDVNDSDVDDAPIVRFVNKILMEAISKGASDVHFEPYEKRYRVRIRIDGILQEIASPPISIGNRISTRLKVMSRLDISERRMPQDGRMKLKLSKTRSIDFRVSTLPILFGEKIVLRILDSGNLKFGAETLGMTEDQKREFIKAIKQPQGMILITGPTGSGKTVTLYSALSILNTNDRNISTVEDPAEIYLPGVNQVNINAKIGLTFASCLRSFLRQDPDVIMVGEIRDTETADIGMKAAQTGHLVLSTLHTNDASQTLLRLVNMGVEAYNIVASVSLIVAQRLARKLCKHCKQVMELPDDVLLQQGFMNEELGTFTLYGPSNGCTYCNTGYKDRCGIFEVLPINDSISKVIIQGGNATDIANTAKQEGIWDLRRAGLEKVKSGVTSIEEINRVTSE